MAPSFAKLEESWAEFTTLASLIQDERAPSVPEAVQQLCDSAIAQLPRDGDAATELDYRVSVSVLELAQRHNPSKHTRLVEFMNQFHKQTALSPSTGRPMVFDRSRLWEDLPSFGYSQLEAWYETGGWPDGDVWDTNMDPECRRRWVNLNAFLAQLTQATDFDYLFNPDSPATCTPSPGYAMDSSSMMLHTASLAFENGIIEAHAAAEATGILPVEVLEMPVVWATCEWFIHAADRLWEHVEKGLIWEDATSVSPGSKYAEKNWRGFERERWDLWEQWLRDLNKVQEDSEGGRKVSEALRKIRQTKEKASVLSEQLEAMVQDGQSK